MESILHSINDLLINTWEEGLTRTTCSRLQILFFPNWLSTSHYGPENVKMFRPKNLWNQIKSISRKKFFLTKFLLICNFTNGQKSIFELGKSLKLPEMKFFCLDFLKFSSSVCHLLKYFFAFFCFLFAKNANFFFFFCKKSIYK